MYLNIKGKDKLTFDAISQCFLRLWAPLLSCLILHRMYFLTGWETGAGSWGITSWTITTGWALQDLRKASISDETTSL